MIFLVKVKDIKHEKCVRKTFAKIGDAIDMPNFIKVQKDSYEWFLKEGLEIFIAGWYIYKEVLLI